MEQARVELGTWMLVTSVHTCFYEGWCTEEHVESALEEVEEPVKT